MKTDCRVKYKSTDDLMSCINLMGILKDLKGNKKFKRIILNKK